MAFTAGGDKGELGTELLAYPFWAVPANLQT
jgi:hypothetical protein